MEKGHYRDEAERILATMQETMRRAPNGFGRLLTVADACLAPSQEIVVAGELPAAATQALLAEVRRRYLPHTVVALGRPGGESTLPLLRRPRPVVQGPACGVRLRELRLPTAGDDAGGAGETAVARSARSVASYCSLG